VLTLTETVPDTVFGPTDLIAENSRYEWVPTLGKLANLASLIALDYWHRVAWKSSARATSSRVCVRARRAATRWETCS
jgi:hypothetical protein